MVLGRAGGGGGGAEGEGVGSGKEEPWGCGLWVGGVQDGECMHAC